MTMAKTAVRAHHEPLFHVVKRDDMPAWAAWLIRVATILLGFVVVGILSMLVTGSGFGDTYAIMFKGVFGTLFTTQNFGSAWMPIVGWAIVALFAAILTTLIIRKNKQLKAEYELSAAAKANAKEPVNV